MSRGRSWAISISIPLYLPIIDSLLCCHSMSIGHSVPCSHDAMSCRLACCVAPAFLRSGSHVLPTPATHSTLEVALVLPTIRKQHTTTRDTAPSAHLDLRMALPRRTPWRSFEEFEQVFGLLFASQGDPGAQRRGINRVSGVASTTVVPLGSAELV